MSLSEKLKNATLAQHQRLEGKIVAHIKSITALEDYKKLLELFYGFFGSIELNINSYIDEKILPDFRNRRKSNWLLIDLKALPGNLTTQPSLKDGAFVTNLLETFGALYVMEGSTLGGQVIKGIITQQLKNDTIPTLFFSGYGNDTKPMWIAFKSAIDNLTLTTEEELIIIEGANQTFKHFADYIDIKS